MNNVVPAHEDERPTVNSNDILSLQERYEALCESVRMQASFWRSKSARVKLCIKNKQGTAAHRATLIFTAGKIWLKSDLVPRPISGQAFVALCLQNDWDLVELSAPAVVEAAAASVKDRLEVAMASAYERLCQTLFDLGGGEIEAASICGCYKLVLSLPLDGDVLMTRATEVSTGNLLLNADEINWAVPG